MAPRSRTGCLTCRQRKLKCDEQKPVCGQCVKAQRECVPSSGITFRHQQNPSMNGEDTDSLKSFYGYKETFAKSTTWVGVPKDLTFVHTSNPYEDEDADEFGPGPALAHQSFGHAQRDHEYALDQAAYPAYATHGLEALSHVATQDQYGYAPQPALTHHRSASQHSHSQLGASPQMQHTTPSQGLDFILNPASNLSPAETASNIDPRLHSHTPTGPPSQHQSPTHVRTQSMTSIGGLASSRSKGLFPRGALEDPELAYLLRDARNHALAWMDLYDSNSFFAARVPVLAVDCPLLLYSCACLSAKSLARVDGRRPIMDGQVAKSRQSKMEFWPGPPMDTESWMRKGREYYDIAVSLLRQSLAGASRPRTSSLPATAATLMNVQGAPLPTTDSDELVAATAILCVYEFLDASGPEWSRHLDGAKTLFDIAKDQAVPLTLPPSPVSIAQQITQQLASRASPGYSVPRVKALSPGRKAVFWNFARQDMLSAFINNTSTRLDTGDLSMWRSAGLKLTLDGYVCPSHPQCSGYVAEQAMGDDMIGNALVWLVMKLVNFIAAGNEVQEDISPLGLDVRQRELLEHWESLEQQLHVWHEGLPDGFRPVAIRRSALECETEYWIPRPMCASTMQWYNFAKIQLLHNKPHLSTATPLTGVLGSSAPGTPGTSLAARHASDASILQQSRAHAKAIIAISNGRSDEGTRIHSVQPMWTAGLVLGNDQHGGENGEVSHEAETWRKAIVDLLRGLERDMGWASEYRVQSLLQLWGLDPSWPADGFNEDMKCI